MVSRITLPLYDSKSINVGIKPTLNDSIIISYNVEKALLHDTTVIDTTLYDSIVHGTLYQLPLWYKTVINTPLYNTFSYQIYMIYVII